MFLRIHRSRALWDYRSKTKSVDNDATLEISAKQALVHARAGVDMIAPSGMMDGVITTLRKALDKEGFENLL